jgi:hypothetical protein
MSVPEVSVPEVSVPEVSAAGNICSGSVRCRKCPFIFYRKIQQAIYYMKRELTIEAFKVVWPTVQTQVCWFHHKQAIFRKAVKSR